MQHLAPDDEFLQIAAGKRARGIFRAGSADIEFLDDFFGKEPGLGPVQQAVAHQLFACGRSEQGVFREAHIRGGGMAEALFGGAEQPQIAPGCGAEISHRLTVQFDRVGRGGNLTGEGGEQLILTVACDPANAKNLALLHGEMDILERRAKGTGGVDRQTRDIKRHRAEAALGPGRGGKRAADHLFGHLTRRGLGRDTGADVFAQPQNGGVIAKGANFFQLMRDIKDRYAGSGKLAQGFEQNFNLLRGQDGSGLVHDQKLGVLEQTADNLDPLTLARRQIAHGAERIKRQAVGFRDLTDAGCEIALVWRVFHAKCNVFGHVQGVEQREMLKHHGHAQLTGDARLGRSEGLALKGHGAAVGFDQTVDHFHEGGFSGAVFAQQCMDFARADFERDVIIGDDPGVGFGQAIHRKKRFSHFQFSPKLPDDAG